MSPVGAFPGMANIHRRTIRAEVNPLDKSTVVSVFPREINEVKHTIQPGHFHLDSGSPEKPAILVVGPSSWWREIDEEQPLLEIVNSSIQIADSIVRDYCSGLLACNMGDCMPGIFWVPGEFTIPNLRIKYQHLLDKAIANQRKYWTALVRLADALWARTNGNPLVISDDMRIAAKELGLNEKDWMKDFTMIQKTNCPACGSPHNLQYPVCPTCKAIINKDKAKEMGIVFAT